MLQPINRPNFFPGQLVDYRDFNRLSQQADRTLATLCQYLFRGGGVIVDALEELRVEPGEGLTVRLRPGVALLPDGRAVCLTDDRILDLAPYRDAAGDAPLVVSLTHVVLGADRFVDEADPSVGGFRTELILPDVVMTTGKPPENGVELFRVLLSAATARLRLADAAEGWTAAPLAGPAPEEATLDRRFRPTIVPQTYVPLSTASLIDVRAALYSIERSHRKIGRLYLLTDPFHAVEYLTQAHAEILSRPFQPLKVSFLVAEMADRLARYLEHLSTKLGAAGKKFDEKSLFEAAALLAPFRLREVLPVYRPLEPLGDVARALEAFVDFAVQNYRLVGTLEEALLDLRHRNHAFEDEVLLGGHAFARVDRIGHEDSGKWTLRASPAHVRTVSAQFRNGDSLSRKGTFFAQGTVTVEMEIPHSDRVACLLLRQYVRRSGSVVQYEINGKSIGAERLESPDEANRWINRGLVVPASCLVPGRNRLRIVVERADLDFGFFEAAVYQPRNAEVER